jgi:hypothetical protein
MLAGFENLAHAAFTQGLQENVLSKHQFLSLALENLLDLVFCEPAALPQFSGKRLQIGKLRGQDAREFFQLRSFQQTESTHRFDEDCDGTNGHVALLPNRVALWSSSESLPPALRSGVDAAVDRQVGAVDERRLRTGDKGFAAASPRIADVIEEYKVDYDKSIRRRLIGGKLIARPRYTSARTVRGLMISQCWLKHSHCQIRTWLQGPRAVDAVARVRQGFQTLR